MKFIIIGDVGLGKVGLLVAVGDCTKLNQLCEASRINLANQYHHLDQAKPVYQVFHAEDVRNPLEDISNASTMLGYAPKYRIGKILKERIEWYINQHRELIAFSVA